MMDLQGIIISVSVVAGCGLLISVFLSFFGRKFAVPVNEVEEAVLAALPGTIC